jgi:threonine/homoserine/homoserine lactone efflux protein
MNLVEFIPYIVALAIACAIPGPGIAGSVGTALGAGFRPALWFVSGIVVGDLIFLSLAVFGLAAVAQLFAGIFTVIKFAGAAYLLWLAWTFWRAGVDPTKMRARSERGPLATLLAGLSLTLGNPKTIIFYLALLPTVIDLHTITPERYAVLAVLTILILYAVCIPYIALTAQARAFLANPRQVRLLNRGAAVAMASAAAFIAIRE